VVIGRVRRHRHAATLLQELTEPGLLGPHGVPHLLDAPPGSADQRPELLAGRPGSLTLLADWLNEPLDSRPQRQPVRPAWHCTVQAHPLDPELSDRQWAGVATYVMHRTGLAPRGDRGAVRWVAARHGDHIHIIATLARQDGGPLPSGSDHSGVRNACHAAEARLALHSTRLTGRAVSADPCAVGRATGTPP
jgi:hypothetical protein